MNVLKIIPDELKPFIVYNNNAINHFTLKHPIFGSYLMNNTQSIEQMEAKLKYWLTTNTKIMINFYEQEMYEHFLTKICNRKYRLYFMYNLMKNGKDIDFIKILKGIFKPSSKTSLFFSEYDSKIIRYFLLHKKFDPRIFMTAREAIHYSELPAILELTRPGLQNPENPQFIYAISPMDYGIFSHHMIRISKNHISCLMETFDGDRGVLLKPI